MNLLIIYGLFIGIIGSIIVLFRLIYEVSRDLKKEIRQTESSCRDMLNDSYFIISKIHQKLCDVHAIAIDIEHETSAMERKAKK